MANHFYTVAAVNVCGTGVASAPATGYAYCPGDYSMTVSPLSQTVNAGSFAPSGIGTALLTVNSAKTTHSGTYTLTLVGTSGALRHSMTISLIVR